MCRRDVFHIVLRGSEEQILVCNFVCVLTLPCFLKMRVTLATFHLDGKVLVDMQWFMRRATELDMDGAAIFNNLGLNPSAPVALFSGIEFSI